MTIPGVDTRVDESGCGGELAAKITFKTVVHKVLTIGHRGHNLYVQIGRHLPGAGKEEYRTRVTLELVTRTGPGLKPRKRYFTPGVDPANALRS